MSGANDLLVVAEGSTRLCLRDPSDPGYILKLQVSPRDRTPAGWRERFRRWLGREIRYFGENPTELRAWRQLQRRLGADVLAGRIAACHGMVETAFGPALKCECITLPDGAPAPSLYRVLFGEPVAWPDTCRSRFSGDAPGVEPSPLKRLLQEAVSEFEGFLLGHDIPLFDLNAGNFVVVPAGEGVRLVCVDAKSTVSGKELIPVSRWIPWLRRRKVRRRAERLRQRIRGAL